MSKSTNSKLLQLLNLVRDTNKEDILTNFDLQIFAIKEIDIKKKEKKIYNIALCDNEYKFAGFIIKEGVTSKLLRKGYIINLQKINPRKIKGGLYILVREYNIISNEDKILPQGTKTIKEKGGCFLDESGNVIMANGEMEEEDERRMMEINNPSESLETVYTPLEQLTTFSRDFAIFVRVLKKSEIKLFETRNNNTSNNQGKLFYFIVLDKENNEMQCTCFNKAADKFFNIIEEDQLYEIKGGYVKINDKKFTRNKSDYKIVLEENSVITKKNDNGLIKKKTINIAYIKEIQNMKLYTVIDLCVVVLDVGDKVMKNTRNGNQPLKKITVGDISRYKIELSLWRIHSQSEVKPGDLLLLHNVKVGEFKGRNISTFDETSIKVNPSKSEKCVQELEDFIFKQKPKFQDFKELENISEIKAQKAREIEDSTFCTVHIRDVLEYLDDIDDVNNISKISATVTQIMHNEKNFYIGCQDRNCKRKLIYESITQDYSCPNCGRKTKSPTYYYTLSLRVKDASCEQWIDIFGKTAENIMQYTAEEYKEILFNRNEDKLKNISERIEFKNFNFWVKPKLQMYNTCSKKKLYAYRIEPIDKKNEAYKLVDYLLSELN